MRKSRAKQIAVEISELPPDRLLKYIDTGRADISLKGRTLKIMPLRNEVLDEIQGACIKYGFVDQEEIIKKFKKEFGIMCSRAARREISLLVEDGIIKKEEEGEKHILRLF